MGKQFRLKISPFCNRRVVTALWAPSVFIPDWNQVQAKKKRNQKGKVRYWLWRGGGRREWKAGKSSVGTPPQDCSVKTKREWSKQYSSGGYRPSDKGGHLDPEIRGGGGGLKFFFSALRASIWSKKNPSLDSPLYSAYLAAAYPGCRKNLVSPTSIAFTAVKGLYKKLTRRALALLQSKSRDCGLYMGCTSNGGAMVLVGTC